MKDIHFHIVGEAPNEDDHDQHNRDRGPSDFKRETVVFAVGLSDFEVALAGLSVAGALTIDAR